MKTLAIDESRDVITKEGMLVFAKDQHAASYVCKNFALALSGEMIHKTDQGMPFIQYSTSSGSLAQFEASLKRRMKQVPMADAKVVSFDAELVDSELKYTAYISTKFGAVTQNG